VPIPFEIPITIAQLVQAPALAEEMGKQGRARVIQHFTLTQMAQHNESFYSELLYPLR